QVERQEMRTWSRLRGAEADREGEVRGVRRVNSERWAAAVLMIQPLCPLSPVPRGYMLISHSRRSGPRGSGGPAEDSQTERVERERERERGEERERERGRGRESRHLLSGVIKSQGYYLKCKAVEGLGRIEGDKIRGAMSWRR